MTRRPTPPASPSTVTPSAIRKALDVILRAIEAPAALHDGGALAWVPASALGMSNAQASRWARRCGIAFAKVGKGTMLRRAEVERFLDEHAAATPRAMPPAPIADDVDASVMSVLRRASGAR